MAAGVDSGEPWIVEYEVCMLYLKTKVTRSSIKVEVDISMSIIGNRISGDTGE